MGRLTANAAWGAIALAALAACTQILGLAPASELPPPAVVDAAIVVDRPEASAVESCPANTAVDPANCGRCGHVCRGLSAAPACAEGRCVPELVAPYPASDLHVSSGMLAWRAPDAVYVTGRGDAGPLRLAVAPGVPFEVDDQALYYAQPGGNGYTSLLRVQYADVDSDASVADSGIPRNATRLALAWGAISVVRALPSEPSRFVYYQPQFGQLFAVDRVDGGGVKVASAPPGTPVSLFGDDAGGYVARAVNSVSAVTRISRLDFECDASSACDLGIVASSPCDYAAFGAHVRFCQASYASANAASLELYEVATDGSGRRSLNSQLALPTDFNGQPVATGLLLVPEGVLVASGGKISLMPDDGGPLRTVVDTKNDAIRALGTDGTFYYFSTTHSFFRVSP